MTKTEAIALLGQGSHKRAAEVLGITSSALSQWSDPLPDSLHQRVIGAALIAGILTIEQCRQFKREAQ